MLLTKLKAFYPQLYSHPRGICCGGDWHTLSTASAELPALAGRDGVEACGAAARLPGERQCSASAAKSAR